MNILFISFEAPYDNVNHAGGKTCNYYIKAFNRNKQNNVRCVCFFRNNENSLLDFSDYGIEYSAIKAHPFSRKERIKYAVKHPVDKYAHKIYPPDKKRLLDELKKIKDEGYYPNVIICEWISITLMIDDIKDIFPKAKFVASEHDVSFQGSFRSINILKNPIEKVAQYFQYHLIKQRELNVLNKCDCVCPHNVKDAQILIENGIHDEKIHVIVPYYEHNFDLKRNSNGTDIVFYGAMNRPANYLSAIWFIENVFDKLIEHNQNLRLLIVGGNPHESLKRYENEHIIITGFVSVEQLQEIFSQAFCFIAPLVLGSGIKVKVLEAFSSGIPVLTNEIGIEGINAEDGRDYLFCSTVNDYVTAIDKLMNREFSNFIGENGRKFVMKNFNLSESVINYQQTLENFIL